MFEIGDHPVVANMMRTGYPDGQEQIGRAHV